MDKKDIDSLIKIIKDNMELTDLFIMSCPNNIECTSIPNNEDYEKEIETCCTCWRNRLEGVK